jgi:phage I-like protein
MRNGGGKKVPFVVAPRKIFEALRRIVEPVGFSYASLVVHCPIVNVEVASLIATQTTVDPQVVREFVDEPDLARGSGKRHKDGRLIDIPFVVQTKDGKRYIFDGHHRATAAFERGEKMISVRLARLGKGIMETTRVEKPIVTRALAVALDEFGVAPCRVDDHPRENAVAEAIAMELPTFFRIFTIGEIDTSKGLFLFDAEAASLVLQHYKDQGNDLSIDYEHQAVTDPPMMAPAAGYFALELRTDGLYAVNVRWTPKAQEMLLGREYKYFSPAFAVDPDTNRITKLFNVALTNIPATKNMTPLIEASETVGRIAQTRTLVRRGVLPKNILPSLRKVRGAIQRFLLQERAQEIACKLEVELLAEEKEKTSTYEKKKEKAKEASSKASEASAKIKDSEGDEEKMAEVIKESGEAHAKAAKAHLEAAKAAKKEAKGAKDSKSKKKAAKAAKGHEKAAEGHSKTADKQGAKSEGDKDDKDEKKEAPEKKRGGGHCNQHCCPCGAQGGACTCETVAARMTARRRFTRGLVYGLAKGGFSIQSLIFPKKHWSKASARRWAKDHDFAPSIDETKNNFRFRQRDPESFENVAVICLTPAGKKAGDDGCKIKAVGGPLKLRKAKGAKPPASGEHELQPSEIPTETKEGKTMARRRKIEATSSANDEDKNKRVAASQAATTGEVTAKADSKGEDSASADSDSADSTDSVAATDTADSSDSDSVEMEAMADSDSDSGDSEDSSDSDSDSDSSDDSMEATETKVAPVTTPVEPEVPAKQLASKPNKRSRVTEVLAAITGTKKRSEQIGKLAAFAEQGEQVKTLRAEIDRMNEEKVQKRIKKLVACAIASFRVKPAEKKKAIERGREFVKALGEKQGMDALRGYLDRPKIALSEREIEKPEETVIARLTKEDNEVIAKLTAAMPDHIRPKTDAQKKDFLAKFSANRAKHVALRGGPSN